jgi:hypothetical protein
MEGASSEQSVAFPTSLQESSEMALPLPIALRDREQYPYKPYSFGLLRACRERPRCCRATETAMNSRRLIPTPSRAEARMFGYLKR